MTDTESTQLRPLVELARSADEQTRRDASQQIVAAAYGELLKECRWRTRDDEEAADAAGLAAVTLLDPKVYQGIAEADSERSLWAWVRGVARRKSSDTRRKRPRIHIQSLDDMAVDLPDDTVEIEARVQIVLDVRDALSKIDPTFRDPLILVDGLGWSYREAANELKIKRSDVNNRLHRGRKALKALLEAGGYTHA